MNSGKIKYGIFGLWAAFMLLMSFSSCKLDDSIYIDPIEIGADKNTYILPVEAGEVEVEVLANQRVLLNIINDASWGKLSQTEVSSDTKVKFTYSQNTGFPRMTVLELSADNSDKRDTVYLKQQGTEDYLLQFSKLSATCAGAGGNTAVDLETNLAIQDLNVKIDYAGSEDKDWIGMTMQISDGELRFTTQPNTHQTRLRRATITLSIVDGWGQLLTTSILLTQANAQEKFGEQITFDQARVYFDTDTVRDDVYIEGVVISNQASGNVGDAPQITSTSWDRTVTRKTAYVQSLDGSRGFKLMFNEENENILEFGSKVEILLRDTHIEKSIDRGPERYTVTNVSLANLLNSSSGSEANIVRKEKYIGDLTPDDVYTYVTMKDCEFPIRKGALSMVEEGNSGYITGAYRVGKSVRLVRDMKGGSLYLFTNTACPYRRAGAGAFTTPARIPYGSGQLSGVVVHEPHSRYEWEDTDDEDTYGYIGDYQLRHQRQSDIDFRQDFEQGFSAFIVEWQYYYRVNGQLIPTNGTGVLSHTSPKYSLTAYNTRDYSALAMGTISTLTGGNGCFLPNGNPLPVNESQGNNTGKGWFVGSGDYGSAWSNKFWWDTDIDRGEAWLIKFSTQGISTDQLSLQVSVLNSAIKSPRDFAVEWSLHDDSDRLADDWIHIADYTVPDFTVWASTQNHQSNAFKEINIPLPLEMLGKSAVYIRLRAKEPMSSGGGAYRDFDLRTEANNSAPTAVSSMNYCAIRYNK